MTEGITARRLKNGRTAWLIKYDIGPDPVTGKRRQRYKTCRGTKKEAAAARRELLTGVEDGNHVDTSKITVSDFAKDWLNNIAALNVGAKSLERYTGIVEGNIQPAIGDVHLQKLNAQRIEAMYANALKSGRRDGRAGGLNPLTVRHIHRVLKQILASAVKKKLLKFNPMDAVETKLKVEQKEVVPLNPDELTTLIRAAGGLVLYMPTLLAATTGMRRGEILGLRWRDIDFERQSLLVLQAIEETKEGLDFKEPKTKAARRKISLPAFVVEALRRHRREQAEQRLVLGLGKDKRDLVFTTLEGQPCRPRNFSKQFSRLVKRALPRHVRFHDLRHTHASQLLAQGTNVKVVCERLGHSNISITLQVYGHLMPNMQEDAAAMLNDTLGRALE